MEERVLEALEFDKVLRLLEARCDSPLGAELARASRPATDIEEVSRRQQETSEAAALVEGSPVSLAGVHDLRPHLRRAEAGSTLQTGELLQLMETLATARALKRLMQEQKRDFPALKARAAFIGTFRELEDEIGRCISGEGEVRDQASPELTRLRRQRRALQARVRERMEGLVRSAEGQRYLQEPIITVRQDRYVVPVKQEYRHQVPGIIHDQSASGATLFVEPMEVVVLNNEVRRLALLEKEEVDRILGRLTARVASEAGALKESLETLAALDLALARGRLALEMKATRPVLNTRGYLNLRAARHPLLKGEVVPVDLHLGGEFDILVITGPNTGGKTVTLKTVGLLTLMAQAGLHVPVGPGTELSVFDQVFCDIGDEQSIEQSLSTFSSHMSNIVKIVERANHRTLVLLDELGAGTDPQEGAALGMALLDYLLSTGARTVATTHYSELKAFAYTRPRVENASVEFDVETLRPTYHLVVGLPGRSNAFEIAGRLGLKPEILEKARIFLGREERRTDELIREVERDRFLARKEREESEAVRIRLEGLEREYRARLESLRERERAALEQAREQARQLIRRVRAEAEGIIEELKQASRTEAVKERSRAIEEARRRLQEVRGEVEQAGVEPPAAYPPAPAAIKPGETVYVVSLRQKGRVLTAPDADGSVTVQVGVLKVQAHLRDLARAPDGAEREAVPASNLERLAGLKRQELSPELNLRGLTVEEAMARADKYLDDAYLAGIKQVRIIHGKGTGALRRAIGAWLETHPHVRSFRPGGAGEGGEGVTLVELA